MTDPTSYDRTNFQCDMSDIWRHNAEVREHRRYEIAKAIMAGLANAKEYENDFEGYAVDAVRFADALLAELEKK